MAFATAQNTAHLFCSDGKVFRVYKKEKPVNKIFQADVLLEKITEDTLYLKLEFEDNARYGISIYLLEKGKPASNKEFNYRISLDKKKISVEFMSADSLIPLPVPLVPGEIKTDTSQRNKLLDHFCELKNSVPVYFNNLPAQGLCVTPMPDAYLAHVKLLMQQARGLDHKYAVSENTCKNNCLSVDQLNALLSYIDYEGDRLKLVKQAYVNLVDNQNREDLKKSFRFEVSFKELNTFFTTAGSPKARAESLCQTASTDEELRLLVVSLNAVPDAQKLVILKKESPRYCFSTQQVMLILQNFLHDREKLEASKTLYFACMNRSDYMSVSQLFSYSTSTAALKDFLEKQK